MTVDRALLQAVQDGSYWLDQHGVWRHNRMRPVTDDEAAQLDEVAVCEPGRTAHLTREACDLLWPEEAPTGASAAGPVSAAA